MRFISRARRKSDCQSGQTNILVLLALGIFFLGFLGFAVDYSNLWFHRQMAQGAADAACQAGAMDLLVNATNGSTLGGFGSPPAAFDCATNPTSAVCKYAVLNGYPSAPLVAGTPGALVKVTFPTSVAGVTPPPTAIAPTPFIQVNVDDRAQVYFSALITGRRTQDVGAQAVCGLQQQRAPIPIIVLNPSCQHSFEVSGSATLKIVGGPSRSVEVNSGNTTCAAATNASSNNCSGNGTIDLSQGGPNFSGSTFGVLGAPPTAPNNFSGAGWSQPAAPIADPFQLMPAPNPSSLTSRAGGSPVGFRIDNCPDNGGCTEFLPGIYNAPIVIAGGTTAIFVPGIYYINPTSYASATSGSLCGSAGAGCTAGGNGQCRADIVVGDNAVLRPAITQPGSPGHNDDDGSHGVMFYTTGPGGAVGYGSMVFKSNAGSGGTQQPTCTLGGTRCIESLPSTSLTCDGTLPDSHLGMPASVNGNILLAQCTSKGTYVGAGSTDTINLSSSGVRGILLFQDRANADQKGQPNLQGSGGLAISGTLYVHNCPSSPSCSWPTDFNAFLDLQGTPGTGTFVLGEIITDQLVEGGNGAVNMALNPAAFTSILKAELMK